MAWGQSDADLEGYGMQPASEDLNIEDLLRKATTPDPAEPGFEGINPSKKQKLGVALSILGDMLSAYGTRGQAQPQTPNLIAMLRSDTMQKALAEYRSKKAKVDAEQERARINLQMALGKQAKVEDRKFKIAQAEQERRDRMAELEARQKFEADESAKNRAAREKPEKSPRQEAEEKITESMRKDLAMEGFPTHALDDLQVRALHNRKTEYMREMEVPKEGRARIENGIKLIMGLIGRIDPDTKQENPPSPEEMGRHIRRITASLPPELRSEFMSRAQDVIADEYPMLRVAPVRSH
jgi:hypothetical protein